MEIVSEPSVRTIMSPRVICVEPTTPTTIAEDIARSHGVSHLIVASEGTLQGVVCICDLWWKSTTTQVADVMATSPARTEPTVSARKARDKMILRDVGCLPVVSADGIAGILTVGDLRRAGLGGELTLASPCAACGSQHHVRRVRSAVNRALCVMCLATKDRAELEAVLRVGNLGHGTFLYI